MPIDDELKIAVHKAVVNNLQPHALEVQLLSFLNELSEQEISEDRKLQRIEALQLQIDLARVTSMERR